MKLKEILSGIEELKAKGNVEVEINNIQTDSRKVALHGLDSILYSHFEKSLYMSLLIHCP